MKDQRIEVAGIRTATVTMPCFIRRVKYLRDGGIDFTAKYPCPLCKTHHRYVWKLGRRR